MLLEASAINSHAEVVGQDIDTRCAKISAVNLGLRGRYGWVICGNSLSGETQFAYRIGSFFHEAPAGLRRGVIRDVPPEQTPVPVIAERMRQQSRQLFDEAESPNRPLPGRNPMIIEVPRWLARIEPQLAALERKQPTSNDNPPERPMSEQEPAIESLPKSRQQRLF